MGDDISAHIKAPQTTLPARVTFVCKIIGSWGQGPARPSSEQLCLYLYILIQICSDRYV